MRYALLILIFLVGIYPILYEMKKGIFDFFNIKNLFILYYLIILVVSGFIALITNNIDVVIGNDYSLYHEYYIKALLAILIGIVTYHFGYYSTSNKPLRLPMTLKSKWKRLNTSIIYLAFLIIGFSCFIIFIIKNGGLANFNRETFRQSGVSGQGILMYPSTQLLAFAAFLLFFSNKIIPLERGALRYSFQKNIKVFLMLFICILPSFIFGFRSLIGVSILQFLIIFNYGYKKIPILRLIFIFTFLLLGFTLYGIVREIPAGHKINREEISNVLKRNPILGYNVLMRTRGTEIVATVIKKMEETHEYDLGYKSIFEAITIPIPHAIWKNKPLHSGVRFTTYFFGDSLAKSRGIKKTNFGGIPTTVIGELFWHFSWLGIVLIMFFLGVLYKKVYYTFLQNRKHLSVLFIYAIFFPSFVLFAETLQGYVNGMVIATIPIIFIHIILKIKLKYEVLDH